MYFPFPKFNELFPPTDICPKDEKVKRDNSIKVIVRNSSKLKDIDKKRTEVSGAEVTKPKSLEHCCDNIDTVISTVGITRQKDGLTLMSIDIIAPKYGKHSLEFVI